MIGTNSGPLSGKLVIALEQAVAAPFCSSRLADAGARVIKIERKGAGDFARAYDTALNGESAYFTWLNRGKQSVALDIKADEDREILLNMLETADVFIQNLLPGALTKLGLDSATLREKFPRLVTCDITGYGEDGPMRSAKAYDLLANLDGEGAAKPPTVYRALDFLQEMGLAHKIESLNAYVACGHTSHAHSAVFIICDTCGGAEELHAVETGTALNKETRAAGFTVRSAVIEARGICRDCTS